MIILNRQLENSYICTQEDVIWGQGRIKASEITKTLFFCHYFGSLKVTPEKDNLR